MRIIGVILLLMLSVQIKAYAQYWTTRTGKVSFFSSAPFEDIKANSQQATAIINQNNGELKWVVPIKSFQFKKALMQEHFNENYLESERYPQGIFVGKIEDISAVDFTKEGVYPVVVKGKLTLHGVTREIETSGKLIMKDGMLLAYSKFNLALADYNIKIPRVVIKNIAKEVEVTVNTLLLKN